MSASEGFSLSPMSPDCNAEPCLSPPPLHPSKSENARPCPHGLQGRGPYSHPTQGRHGGRHLTDSVLVAESSLDFKKRLPPSKNGKNATRKPSGARPDARMGLKLEHKHPLGLAEGPITKLGYLGDPGRKRNYCARGSPPKTRYSGHQNSRLMRGASKQGQTKSLSYYMREGQMGNKGARVRSTAQ